MCSDQKCGRDVPCRMPLAHCARGDAREQLRTTRKEYISGLVDAPLAHRPAGLHGTHGYE